MLFFKKNKTIVGFLLCLGLWACQTSPKTEKTTVLVKNNVVQTSSQISPKMCDSLKAFQTFKIAGHIVDIAVPKGKIKGNLLLLQGFAFPKDDWCKKSSLCKKALEEGYVLVMPEMGKSTYSTKFYPETRKDWQVYPNKSWLTDSVFKYLQEQYCLLLPTQKNYIIGLSTGARGVAIVALEHPTLFTAVAALSGDYDQTKIPKDNVMIGYYGSFAQFPKRWAEDDNVVFQIEKWKTPIYIGHGKLDAVVPHEQSILLYEVLKKKYPQLPLKLNISVNHAHDYTYWDAEVGNMLGFFRDLKN